MKKLILIAATCLMFSAAAEAQVTVKNTPLKLNYLTKATAAQQIYTSALYETTPANFGTSTGTFTLNVTDAYIPAGCMNVKSKKSDGTTFAFKATNSESTSLFSLRDNGAIFTGTTQAVSSGSFVAGSNTITVKNGLITRIE